MGIRRQLQRFFRRLCPFFDVIFQPNVQFECCMILQGTLGGNFDMFAAGVNPVLGCSSGKPRSRPIGMKGLSCSPIQLFQHRI